MFDLQENRSNPNVKQVVHALSEEGMEDRSDISRDTFSFVFLNKWKGANVRAIFERIGADRFFPRLHQGPAPFYRFGDDIPPFDGSPFVDDRLSIDDSDDFSLLTDDSSIHLVFSESEDDLLPFEFFDFQPQHQPEIDEQPPPTNPEQTTPGGTSGERSSS
ncbi:hypothetical protein BLNAU_1017 [Blattamonas nauphoetae]|uniref:Uncharacterized protein n=1 Tax=Blattamonas nauphoetae TaxID=2049346 RepID=A0ABQ9YJK3_9EUKA|nr:hypothetical protein BLNAU_1017 [Blattamonas nauphoetae]